MKVRQALNAKGETAKTVRPNITVERLTHVLGAERVGALVVTADNGDAIGIVSERDVVSCIARRGRAALDLTVAEIMTAKLFTCSPEDSLTTVARQMTARRVRHVPVMEDGRLIGVVSIGDVVKHRLAEIEMEADVLRDLAIAGH